MVCKPALRGACRPANIAATAGPILATKNSETISSRRSRCGDTTRPQAPSDHLATRPSGRSSSCPGFPRHFRSPGTFRRHQDTPKTLRQCHGTERVKSPSPRPSPARAAALGTGPDLAPPQRRDLSAGKAIIFGHANVATTERRSGGIFDKTRPPRATPSFPYLSGTFPLRHASGGCPRTKRAGWSPIGCTVPLLDHDELESSRGRSPGLEDRFGDLLDAIVPLALGIIQLDVRQLVLQVLGNELEYLTS